MTTNWKEALKQRGGQKKPALSWRKSLQTRGGQEQPANVHDRFTDYKKDHCWQYEIRQQNKAGDLIEVGLTEAESKTLTVADFDFIYVDRKDKSGCKEIKTFIERHEWLGKMPIWATHRFIARHKTSKQLAGVVVMATPYSFSNLLGTDNRGREKLIARGASISWSPKNLGSWMIMQAIRWMVKNTDFRFFTAYSDPEAKELGTIYQACNFHYLGQKFGDKYQYLDLENKKRGWFSSSGFNDRSQIIRYAKKLGIEWQSEWYKIAGTKKNIRKVQWSAIPDSVSDLLKQERKDHRDRCKKRRAPAKHKYCYILGNDKRETRELLKQFAENSPDKVGLTYPKTRGS